MGAKANMNIGVLSFFEPSLIHTMFSISIIDVFFNLAVINFYFYTIIRVFDIAQY